MNINAPTANDSTTKEVDTFKMEKTNVRQCLMHDVLYLQPPSNESIEDAHTRKRKMYLSIVRVRSRKAREETCGQCNKRFPKHSLQSLAAEKGNKSYFQNAKFCSGCASPKIFKKEICQNDVIFDTALKQLKSSSCEQDDGLCAGKYLMSIVQSGGKETSPDTTIDSSPFLGGEFIKGIVENDKSMLDLLFSQNFREKVHNDTEKLILDYLAKSAEKSTTVHNCDRRNTDQHDKTIEDITNMVMAISKHIEKHMADAARKGVLLSYVEVKNMTHASVASQLHEAHTTPQNEHLRSRIDSRAGDTNKSRSNPNWNTNPEEKMKAVIIEHDQFMKELVDAHNKRESVLLEEIETQKVMHSKMVENCLLASSKALKVIRDKVAEEYWC